MNDFIEQELARIVDSATRSVRASSSRKQQVREELLAHVDAVFAEELAHHADERAALAATALRFGAAEEVKVDLQSSIPLIERLFLISEKELLMSRWFWLTSVALVAIGPAIILPAAAKYRDEGIFIAFPFIAGSAIILAGVAMVGYGLARHFARPA